MIKYISVLVFLICSNLYANKAPVTNLEMPRFVSLKSNDVNLRVGPSVNYPIELKYTQNNLPVEIIDEFDVWRKIKDSENKDPSEVIIDEFIGQSIPIYIYEISHGTEKSSDEALIVYIICFVLFRFFDIVKPFPVSFFDKNYKNSFGVIMDDVCAGFYVVLSFICFMVLSSYLIQ